MSAYMVKDQTINRVVYWLYFEVIRYQRLADKLEKAIGIDTTSYGWTEELGKAMFDLNIAGVNDRYGDREAGKFRKLNYQYVPAHPTTLHSDLSKKIQVLKSLQCWLYQCTEGEVVKRPLYRYFQNVVEPHLMSSIINDLPEFRAAEWG